MLLIEVFEVSFWDVIRDSIVDNYYIGIAAIVALVVLVFSIAFACAINRHFKKGDDDLKNVVYYLLDISYTVFITIISLFPLLGMFGTVKSLIGLGEIFQTDDDMNSIKSEFFLALTSTALGIICSIVYKIINAFFQPFIENQIEKARKTLGI